MRTRHIALAVVCMALIVTMFGAMALAVETACIGWLVGVQAFDLLAVSCFAQFAPDRWWE